MAQSSCGLNNPFHSMIGFMLSCSHKHDLLMAVSCAHFIDYVTYYSSEAPGLRSQKMHKISFFPYSILYSYNIIMLIHSIIVVL